MTGICTGKNQTSPMIGITASKSNIADDFVYLKKFKFQLKH